MPGRLLALFDPFVSGLIGVLLLATIAPPQGAWAAIASDAANVGIVLLFFLHGAKLSRQAILDGARNWQLHLATLATTFVLFPLLGMALTSLPLFDRTTGMGLLFLTLLPSTVQSSIAFTSIARGNVAGAVCSASFSNLLGTVMTPLLVAFFLNGGRGAVDAGATFTAMEQIALQLLLPFLLGHLSRPWTAAWVAGCLWELAMFLLGGRETDGRDLYPAASDLLDPALDNPLAKALFVVVWLAAGVGLLARTDRR